MTTPSTPDFQNDALELDSYAELEAAFFQRPEREDAFYSAKTVELSEEAQKSAFLTLLSPGSWQMLHGKIHQGLCLNMALVVALLMGPLLCALCGTFPIPIYLTVFLLILGCWIVGIVAGFRHPLPRPVPFWSHAALAFLSFWLPFTLAFYVSTTAVFQRTWLGGDMMLPNMLPGDNILVNRLAYAHAKPNYGDLVLVEEYIVDAQRTRRRSLFGRIIARPGDTVQLSGFRPNVNGACLAQYIEAEHQTVFDRAILTYELPHNVQAPSAPIQEPERWYAIHATNQGLFSQTNAVTLEPDYYYVLEDNRDASRDRLRSVYGYIVHRDEVRGRPEFVIFNSYNPDPLARFGLRLR